MRTISNVVLVASLGFAGLMGGGCGTGNMPDSNVSGIFGNSKKRDVAIKALTLHNVFFRLVTSSQDACYTAIGLSRGSSTSQADDPGKLEFKSQCLGSLGEMFYLGNQSDPVEDDLTRPLIAGGGPFPNIAGEYVYASHYANMGIKKATPGLDESVQRVATQAYQDHETGTAAGLKMAKEAARLVLPNIENIRKEVDKVVHDKFLIDKPNYADVMASLKRPMSTPEFAGLLPEARDFYKSQVADIEKSTPVN